MVPIELAQYPPLVENLVIQGDLKIPKEWFERELVKSFSFIMDTESDSNFPPNSRGFSYQRKIWPYTQYVHRSGVSFLQILPEAKGFLWVNNRLHLANTANPKGYSSTNGVPAPHPDVLREQFEAFCGDKLRLAAFWKETEGRLREGNLE